MKCNQCKKEMVKLGETKKGLYGYGCYNPECTNCGEISEFGFSELKP